MKKTKKLESYLAKKGWEAIVGGETKVWQHKESERNIITNPLMTNAEELQGLVVVSELEKRDVWDVMEDIINVSRVEKEEEKAKAKAVKKVDLTASKKEALKNLQTDITQIKEISQN